MPNWSAGPGGELRLVWRTRPQRLGLTLEPLGPSGVRVAAVAADSGCPAGLVGMQLSAIQGRPVLQAELPALLALLAEQPGPGLELEFRYAPLPAAKLVLLVRHAQSEENAKATAAVNGGIGAAVELLGDVAAGADLALSETGRQQLARACELRDRMPIPPGAKVVHSPLSRTCLTCEGLFGPAESLAALVEVSPAEYLQEQVGWRGWSGYDRPVWERIGQFKQWLAAQEESTLVAVGHGKYFELMLGMEAMPDNLDVWQAQLDVDKMAFSRAVKVFSLTDTRVGEQGP